jgi:hypothetical protein
LLIKLHENYEKNQDEVDFFEKQNSKNYSHYNILIQYAYKNKKSNEHLDPS